MKRTKRSAKITGMENRKFQNLYLRDCQGRGWGMFLRCNLLCFWLCFLFVLKNVKIIFRLYFLYLLTKFALCFWLCFCGVRKVKIFFVLSLFFLGVKKIFTCVFVASFEVFFAHNFAPLIALLFGVKKVKVVLFSCFFPVCFVLFGENAWPFLCKSAFFWLRFSVLFCRAQAFRVLLVACFVPILGWVDTQFLSISRCKSS